MENIYFKKDTLVTIYEDWENEKNVIGTGRLIKYKKTGLPFIIKDTIIRYIPNTLSFHGQLVTEWHSKIVESTTFNIYNYERWDVKIIKSQNPKFRVGDVYSLNIRHLIANTSDKNYFKDIKYQKEEELNEEEEEEKYIKECISKNLPIDRFIMYEGLQIY